jgi:release factor glutamine methyltransferase
MRIFRNVISFFRVPLTRYYLRKERSYQYENISIIVKPGVFHPGLFPSTRMLLGYLRQQNLPNSRPRKTLLELGCGTGLISIVAEKFGMTVTSLDISRAAVENTQMNAEKNRAKLQIIHSDLFDKVMPQFFDWIIINPPYYAKDARTEAEAAWHCGANFEYFRKLFPTLVNYMSKDSNVLMTLTESADFDTVSDIASQSGLTFHKLAERHTWLEGSDFIYRITRH